jgi:hypothetical protein
MGIMNKRELEEKVRGVIAQAKLGHKVEDTTIELKAEWPGDESTAVATKKKRVQWAF